MWQQAAGYGCPSAQQPNMMWPNISPRGVTGSWTNPTGCGQKPSGRLETAANCLGGAADMMGHFDSFSEIAPVAEGLGSTFGLMSDMRKICKPKNMDTVQGKLEFMGR
jgi:hypothetical protein